MGYGTGGNEPRDIEPIDAHSKLLGGVMSLDDLTLDEDHDLPVGCIFTVLMWLMLVGAIAWLLWSGDPLDDGQIVKAGSTSTPVIYQGEE